MKLLLILWHGQASVERGFSLNNMGPETVIAKGLIIDQMVANNLKPYTIEITKSMLKAFRSARPSYRIHLEEDKKKAFLTEREKLALHISDNIKKLKLQVKQKDKAVKMMGDEFVACQSGGRKE